MLDAALNVLRTRKSFAVMGVSRDPSKYGHEVFEALRGNHTFYPINPKYSQVDGHRCYASLDALPETPEVVVTALAPNVTEQLVPSCIARGIPLIWMPPECYTERAVELCHAADVAEIHEVCPVFAMGMLHTDPLE